jgi:transposase
MSKTPFIRFPDCSVSQISQDKQRLRFILESTHQSAPCPSCRQISERIHSYYTRRLHDLPISEWQVYLEVETKRFRCSNPACSRKTFVEPLPELTRRYARRTERLSRALWHLVQFSGAQAGSQLAKQLKIMVARDTLLRLLRRDTLFVVSQAWMIGVDDWAKKRGQDYGTILLDLEAHRVIDLLPNRQADTLAAWLSQHSQIQLVTRDLSKEYTQGIQKGAPQALQIADRWHLLKNISEMSERALLEVYPRLKKQPEIPVISAVPLRDVSPEVKKTLKEKPWNGSSVYRSLPRFSISRLEAMSKDKLRVSCHSAAPPCALTIWPRRFQNEK